MPVHRFGSVGTSFSLLAWLKKRALSHCKLHLMCTKHAFLECRVTLYVKCNMHAAIVLLLGGFENISTIYIYHKTFCLQS